MNYDLAAMTRRHKNPRRSTIDIRPIVPTATQAGDLYRAVYLPIIKGWQQWLVRIEEAYARALPVKVGDTHLIADAASDVQSTLDQAEQWLNRLVIAITPALRAWTLRVESWQRGKWRGAVLTATGIDVGTLLGPGDVGETVDAFVTRNVALVRSVTDQARHRIADIVLRGYQTRTPPRDVAKEMRGAVELSRARSIRIAADQSSKLANRLDQARQEQAGLSTYTWRHSLKKHPRPVHVARNGHVFRWDKPPEDGPPGTQPFCGCRAMARMELN